MKIYEVGSVYLSMTKDNTKKFLAEVDTPKDLGKFVYKYQDQLGFQRHYTRCMPARDVEGGEKQDGIIYDVGSYSKFLYVTGITFAEMLTKED